MRLFLMCLALGMMPMAAFAQSVEDEYSQEVMQKLLRARVAVDAIGGMHDRGEITDAQREAGRQFHLAQARDAVGDDQFSLAQLAQMQGQLGVVSSLSWGQRVVGFFTFVNIMWTIASIVGVVCLVWLLIVLPIPVGLYEFIGYGAAFALLFIGHRQSAGVSEYVTFFGVLLLIAMPVASASIHRIDLKAETLFGIAMVASAVCALLTMNGMIGWLTAISLMGMLGFSAVAIPCGYAIGFTSDDGLSRSTSTGFLLLFVFTVIHAVGRETAISALFADAMLWVGSFVAYLGLLIASSRWYIQRQSYLLMQIVTVVAGLAALFVGSVLGVPELQKIGGTFFVLYIIEKFVDLPMRSVEGYLALGVVVSGVVFALAWTIKHHAQELAPYLLWG